VAAMFGNESGRNEQDNTCLNIDICIQNAVLYTDIADF
jgi:hypothetical protein